MNETEKITLRAMTDDIDNILDRLLAFADERTEINMAIMHLTEATDNLNRVIEGTGLSDA